VFKFYEGFSLYLELETSVVQDQITRLGVMKVLTLHLVSLNPQELSVDSLACDKMVAVI
jgi:hypothetical protein